MSYPTLGWAVGYPQNRRTRYVNNLLPTERTITRPPGVAEAGYYVVWDGVEWVVQGDPVYIGQDSVATTNSVAIGPGTDAGNSGTAGIAVGYGATSTGNYGIAIGQDSIAAGGGISIGRDTYTQVEGICIGDQAGGTGTDCLVIGHDATSNAVNNCTVIGHSASAAAQANVAIGRAAAANNWVLNTSAPFALTLSTDAIGGGAPTNPLSNRLRVRINGTNYTIGLYPDE